MAIRCEEEFNPWPSFVDIFSAVILVLMLFLLVTIVNIGYYAQFKYKVQYTGSIVTEDIILQDTAAKVKLKEKKVEVKQQNKTKLMDENLMEETEVQQMQVELQAATDIESAGEDLADKKKSEKESPQKTIQKDRFFYIKYEGNELFVGLDISEKLKEFVKQSNEKYPGHQIHLSATDPLDQISITVTKQITIGRIIAVRGLLKKLDYSKKDVKLKLGQKPFVPEEVEIDNGVVVLEVVN